MKTRHKPMHIIDDDSNSENYSNKKRKKKEDLDEDYNINDYEEDLYSNNDDEEEEDASYLIKNEFNRKYSRLKNKLKNIKSKLTTKKNKKINLIRKSFRNSLGRNKKIFEDNKENVNINNNSNSINNNLKNNKNMKKPKSSSMKKPKKNEILKKIKEEEKQKIESQLDKNYFYQDLTPLQWKEISNFISSSLTKKDLKEEDIIHFFSLYPNLLKGEQNVIKLRQILKNSRNNGFLCFSSKNNFVFESYEKINDFIINNYFMVKPSIFEVHFFPNSSEEIHLINLISKTRTSLDIAMFTINNIRIAEEIKNIFNKGIKLRIITDSECIKMPSSNIYSLAAMGVNIKIDDSSRYHMHHKFCVIDNSVVITGSFNWTDQAVNHNQENLLFLENQNLAMQYSYEFQRLWDDFEIVVTKEKALLKLKEDEEKKRAAESRKKREKEKKLKAKENNKIEKESENEINFEETENNYGDNVFTKKKRYRKEKEIEPNFQSNDDYDYNSNSDNNQFNKNNAVNTQDNKGSSCFIF